MTIQSNAQNEEITQTSSHSSDQSAAPSLSAPQSEAQGSLAHTQDQSLSQRHSDMGLVAPQSPAANLSSAISAAKSSSLPSAAAQNLVSLDTAVQSLSPSDSQPAQSLQPLQVYIESEKQSLASSSQSLSSLQVAVQSLSLHPSASHSSSSFQSPAQDLVSIHTEDQDQSSIPQQPKAQTFGIQNTEEHQLSLSIANQPDYVKQQSSPNLGISQLTSVEHVANTADSRREQGEGDGQLGVVEFNSRPSQKSAESLKSSAWQDQGQGDSNAGKIHLGNLGEGVLGDEHIQESKPYKQPQHKQQQGFEANKISIRQQFNQQNLQHQQHNGQNQPHHQSLQQNQLHFHQRKQSEHHFENATAADTQHWSGESRFLKDSNKYDTRSVQGASNQQSVQSKPERVPEQRRQKGK
jgi:hypothetical protein